jgi:FkbH-like protein
MYSQQESNMTLDFLSLRKNLKKDFSKFPTFNVAILGDSSTQILNQAIRGYGFESGINAIIYESDYDSIERDVLNPSSALYQSSSDYTLLFFSAAKLRNEFYSTSLDVRSSFASSKVEHLTTLITSLREKKNYAQIFLMNFQCEFDEIFGNFGAKFSSAFNFQIRKLNFLLSELASKYNYLHIVDLASLYANYGRDFAFDPKLSVTADLGFSLDFTAVVARSFCQSLIALNGKIKKCIILDLDNTLWGGVIGDDGLENIQIGELGIGKAFTRMQKWLKQLKERGIILAVCSKNTEQIAKEPFLVHKDMQLRLDDFAIFVSNWESKASNIRYIQSVLNIGFDSIVFIDDNKFERELVRKELPLVTIPELPEDPAEYVDFLSNLNLFETVSFSAEDEMRTRQYQEEAKRSVLKNTVGSEEEYLQSLNMTAVVESFTKFNIPRVAQLTQRSNQFNLRTIRYTETDVENIAQDPSYRTLAFQLKDRFGDHGLISVFILKKNIDHLFIDTWVMSCRVLKRGVEEFIINRAVDVAREYGFKEVIGEYLPTAKNGIVAKLYPNLGFRHLEMDTWVLDVETFKPLKTHII